MAPDYVETGRHEDCLAARKDEMRLINKRLDGFDNRFDNLFETINKGRGALLLGQFLVVLLGTGGMLALFRVFWPVIVQ